MTELADLSIAEAHGLLKKKETSVVELVRANLARIDELDELLRAFIAVDREPALARAAELDAELAAGVPLRSLHGVTIGVKDVIPVKDQPFTLGSLEFEHRRADQDAALVGRLRNAGAIIIGKTNTPEFAAFMNTRNAVRGTTLSPWDTEMSSGGSSGGSAVAVAVGMSTAAIGTDHGGSVRFPAATNGILGLRPTPGRVPVFPSPWVYDEFDVHGPLARAVSDLRPLLAAMSGPDTRVPISMTRDFGSAVERRITSVNGLRVAWSPDLGGAFRVEREIVQVCGNVIAKLAEHGARVDEKHPDVTDAIAAIRPLRMARALIEHSERLEQLDALNNELLRENIKKALAASPKELAQGQLARSRAWLGTRSFFDGFDILALPTTQVITFPKDAAFPPVIDEHTVTDALDTVLSTYVFSILGWPSMSVPAGFTATGFPVGIQLVAAPGREELLIDVAETIEAFQPWRNRRASVLAHQP